MGKTRYVKKYSKWKKKIVMSNSANVLISRLDKLGITHSKPKIHSEYVQLYVGNVGGIYLSVECFTYTKNYYIRIEKNRVEGKWLWGNEMPQFPLSVNSLRDSKLIFTKASNLKGVGEIRGLRKLGNSDVFILSTNGLTCRYIFGEELDELVELCSAIDSWNKARLPLFQLAYKSGNSSNKEMFIDILLGGIGSE